jgi:hypothetical protein
VRLGCGGGGLFRKGLKSELALRLPCECFEVLLLLTIEEGICLERKACDKLVS